MAPGSRIAVTGAAGFIASHLCRRLCETGFQVDALSRGPVPRGNAAMRFHAVDLADHVATRRVLDACRPDVIFHLAGVAAAARDPCLVTTTLRSNLLTTVNVLDAARAIGVRRLVLPGSFEEPVDGIPSSPYAASKRSACVYGRMYQRVFGVPVAIARIFMTYGPTRRDLHKLVPYVTLSLLEGRAPRLSSGRRRLDWIHVDDVVEGLLALGASARAPGRTLDLGSGELVSIRELAERIARLVAPSGGARLVFDPARDRRHERIGAARVDRTHRAVGWRPRIGLDEGLARTVAWFERHRGELAAQEPWRERKDRVMEMAG